MKKEIIEKYIIETEFESRNEANELGNRIAEFLEGNPEIPIRLIKKTITREVI